MEWEEPGGAHYSRTTYRSSSADPRRPGQLPDPFSGLLGSFMSPLFRPPGGRDMDGGTRSGFSTSPRIHGQVHFATMSPTNGPQMRTVHFGDAGPENDPRSANFADLAGIFGNVLNGMHGTVIMGGPGGPGGLGGPRGPHMDGRPPHPLAAIAAMLNPANARHGDAVFTQEALDRVISNLMEQHSSSSAPGPASEAAISALPKISIAKDHLDANGKAECSICMDSLNIGDEVTELPCNHWFHGDCVSAWLREHDTCPQCRRGITPQNGDANTPRATGEAPRFWQMQEDDFQAIRSPTEPRRPRRESQPGSSSDGRSRGGSRRVSNSVPNSPVAANSSRPRSEAARALGGIANWMGRRFSGGGSGSSGGNGHEGGRN